VNRIKLGTTALADSSGVQLECDFFINRFSYVPDVQIFFRDELIPSPKKLSTDPAIKNGIDSFLRSIGYGGNPSTRIFDVVGKYLMVEIDIDFMTFAASVGWADLTTNQEAGERHSLESILDLSDVKTRSIFKESDRIFKVDGKRYLVVGFSELSELIKSGIIQNLEMVETSILARSCALSLAETFEEKKDIINTKKDSSNGREEFNLWIKVHLIVDQNFFSSLISSIPIDQVYRISVGGEIIGKTENHIVFELVR
jgi:hypothetical protein